MHPRLPQHTPHKTVIKRPSEEVELTPIFVYLPDFYSFVLPMLFPVHVLEAFDSVTTWLDGFLLHCVLYRDIMREPKPTGWYWIQFMLSKLTGPAQQWAQHLCYRQQPYAYRTQSSTQRPCRGSLESNRPGIFGGVGQWPRPLHCRGLYMPSGRSVLGTPP